MENTHLGPGIRGREILIEDYIAIEIDLDMDGNFETAIGILRIEGLETEPDVEPDEPRQSEIELSAPPPPPPPVEIAPPEIPRL